MAIELSQKTGVWKAIWYHKL